MSRSATIAAVRRAAVAVLPTLAMLAAACRPSPTGAPAATRTITPDELRRDLYVFASDSFLGRETGTAGADRAARFLAARLAALGVEAAGDSGYFQRVPLARSGYGPATAFEVTSSSGRTTLTLGKDLVPLPSLGRDTPPPRVHVTGELAYLGYVAGTDTARADDAANVAGKVVVLVNGAPPGTSAVERTSLEAESRIGPRLRELLPLNPAAVIVLTEGRSAQFAAQLARRYTLEAGDAITVGDPDSARTLPMILLGPAHEGSPLLPDGWPEGAKPGPLVGRRFSARVDNAFTAVNVVAVVRGRDPALNATYVAYGAHYDHIGVQSGALGDSIANGADDDGSGSMALLALARMFQQGPRPRRSVLFVWHVGEEQGLLGSDWFTSHPTVPIDSVVAQINADMIGRNAPDSLYVVGPNAAPNGQSRVVGAVLDSANASLPRPFLVNREWDSPTHPEQIYYRSDHFNYARRGVPILFLTTGLHADYHRVTDEADKIDYEKLARVSALMYQTGRALANRTTRPR
jgi:Peptidase family M28